VKSSLIFGTVSFPWLESQPQGEISASHAQHANEERRRTDDNCDMLVTWNCRHLANANKTGHIRRVNALLGLRTPLLVTPLELLEKDYKPEA